MENYMNKKHYKIMKSARGEIIKVTDRNLPHLIEMGSLGYVDFPTESRNYEERVNIPNEVRATSFGMNELACERGSRHIATKLFYLIFGNEVDDDNYQPTKPK